MRNSISKSLAVAAAGAVMAFGVSQAQAAPTPVSGVIVDDVTTFVFSNLDRMAGTGTEDRVIGEVQNLMGGQAGAVVQDVRQQQEQVRIQVASTLQGIITQQLVPTADPPGLAREVPKQALFDPAARAVALGDHMPVHLGAMPESVRAVMARGPRRTRRSITNHSPSQPTHESASCPSGIDTCV